VNPVVLDREIAEVPQKRTSEKKNGPAVKPGTPKKNSYASVRRKETSVGHRLISRFSDLHPMKGGGRRRYSRDEAATSPNVHPVKGRTKLRKKSHPEDHRAPVGVGGGSLIPSGGDRRGQLTVKKKKFRLLFLPAKKGSRRLSP